MPAHRRLKLGLAQSPEGRPTFTNVSVEADRGYVIETGRITMSGSAEELIADLRIREAYLGDLR